jgi:hypothetical protein
MSSIDAGSLYNHIHIEMCYILQKILRRDRLIAVYTANSIGKQVGDRQDVNFVTLFGVRNTIGENHLGEL